MLGLSLRVIYAFPIDTLDGLLKKAYFLLYYCSPLDANRLSRLNMIIVLKAVTSDQWPFQKRNVLDLATKGAVGKSVGNNSSTEPKDDKFD